MPKQNIKVTIEFEYDSDEHEIPPRIFLYQLLNRLNYDYPVKSVEYGGKKKTFAKRTDVKKVGLKYDDDVNAKKPPKRILNEMKQ